MLSLPNDLSAGVHGHCRLLATELDQNRALVVTDGDVVRPLQRRDRPDALQAVVEGVLQSVSVGVPHADRAVLASGQDDRQLRMKTDGRNVLKRNREKVKQVRYIEGLSGAKFGSNKMSWNTLDLLKAAAGFLVKL